MLHVRRRIYEAGVCIQFSSHSEMRYSGENTTVVLGRRGDGEITNLDKSEHEIYFISFSLS